MRDKYLDSVYMKVYYAVRTGKIIRDFCAFCGSEKFLCAHHENYEKPLDFVCLCRSCHAKLHKHDTTTIEPDIFQSDEEAKKETETAWHQSVHVIENESYIRGRLATAIC